MKIKIAIADDHPLIISGLNYALSGCPDMEVTGCYNNGKELMEALLITRPDVLILDIQMPGQQGDELAEIISKQYPMVKILALTNFDHVYYIKNMMRKGVKGYILKTTMEPVLLDAIRKVNSGVQYIDSALREKLIEDSLKSKKDISGIPKLTSREKEVLQCIALDLTSQEIADKLFLSKHTIDSHRQSLFLKLDVKNMAGLVKKGIQLGLIE